MEHLPLQRARGSHPIHCAAMAGSFPGITKLISGAVCFGSIAMLITDPFIFIKCNSGNTERVLAGLVKQKTMSSEKSTNPPLVRSYLA